MRGVVMYGPGDVRVEEREKPTIIAADGRGAAVVRDVCVRLGPVALPRDRRGLQADPDGP